MSPPESPKSTQLSKVADETRSAKSWTSPFRRKSTKKVSNRPKEMAAAQQPQKAKPAAGPTKPHEVADDEPVHESKVPPKDIVPDPTEHFPEQAPNQGERVEEEEMIESPKSSSVDDSKVASKDIVPEPTELISEQEAEPAEPAEPAELDQSAQNTTIIPQSDIVPEPTEHFPDQAPTGGDTSAKLEPTDGVAEEEVTEPSTKPTPAVAPDQVLSEEFLEKPKMVNRFKENKRLADDALAKGHVNDPNQRYNLGGGMMMTQAELYEIAQRRVNPLLTEIDGKVEKNVQHDVEKKQKADEAFSKSQKDKYTKLLKKFAAKLDKENVKFGKKIESEVAGVARRMTDSAKQHQEFKKKTRNEIKQNEKDAATRESEMKENHLTARETLATSADKLRQEKVQATESARKKQQEEIADEERLDSEGKADEEKAQKMESEILAIEEELSGKRRELETKIEAKRQFDSQISRLTERRLAASAEVSQLAERSEVQQKEVIALTAAVEGLTTVSQGYSVRRAELSGQGRQDRAVRLEEAKKSYQDWENEQVEIRKDEARDQERIRVRNELERVRIAQEEEASKERQRLLEAQQAEQAELERQIEERKKAEAEAQEMEAKRAEEEARLKLEEEARLKKEQERLALEQEVQQLQSWKDLQDQKNRLEKELADLEASREQKAVVPAPLVSATEPKSETAALGEQSSKEAVPVSEPSATQNAGSKAVAPIPTEQASTTTASLSASKEIAPPTSFFQKDQSGVFTDAREPAESQEKRPSFMEVVPIVNEAPRGSFSVPSTNESPPSNLKGVVPAGKDVSEGPSESSQDALSVPATGRTSGVFTETIEGNAPTEELAPVLSSKKKKNIKRRSIFRRKKKDEKKKQAAAALEDDSDAWTLVTVSSEEFLAHRDDPNYFEIDV